MHFDHAVCGFSRDWDHTKCGQTEIFEQALRQSPGVRFTASEPLGSRTKLRHVCLHVANRADVILCTNVADEEVGVHA